MMIGAGALAVLTACSISTGGAKDQAGPTTTAPATSGSLTDDTTASTGIPSGTEPAAAQSAPYDCRDVDASTWAIPATTQDLVAQVAAGQVPSPDEPSGDIGPPALADQYPTPDDFLAQSNVANPAQRRQVMVDSGYTGGIEAEFDATNPPSKVQILAFGDSNGGSAYFAARLSSICSNGGARQVTPLGASGGIAWVDPFGAGHVEFFLGGNQVSLTLCACDRSATMTQLVDWHQAWMDRFAVAEPTPGQTDQ